MKKILALLLSAAMVLSFSGCGEKNTENTVEENKTAENQSTEAEPVSQPEETSSISFTDMTGRSITLDKPAERIVALTASDCEILYALGCGDALVGRGTYCDYPAEVADVTVVESGSNTNVEQIIALEPDVILMGTMSQTEEQTAALEKAGITVVLSDADTIADTYVNIELIGTLMGKDAEAEALVNQMKAAFNEIKNKSTGDGSETIYFEVSPLEYGLWTAGSNTFMDEVAQMLGLTNAFADVDGWGEISEEQVLERNPDYIVTITMYFGEGPTPEEEILSRSGWENVTAVKNGKILNLPNNELSRPIPRLADGAQLLFDFVYGE